jgi:coenzyme PQQ precursor peptide PqqA
MIGNSSRFLWEGIFPETAFLLIAFLRGHRAGVDFSRCCNKEKTLTWNTPRVTEIAVGMEINCYACADI